MQIGCKDTNNNLNIQHTKQNDKQKKQTENYKDYTFYSSKYASHKNALHSQKRLLIRRR